MTCTVTADSCRHILSPHGISRCVKVQSLMPAAGLAFSGSVIIHHTFPPAVNPDLEKKCEQHLFVKLISHLSVSRLNLMPSSLVLSRGARRQWNHVKHLIHNVWTSCLVYFRGGNPPLPQLELEQNLNWTCGALAAAASLSQTIMITYIHTRLASLPLLSLVLIFTKWNWWTTKQVIEETSQHPQV